LADDEIPIALTTVERRPCLQRDLRLPGASVPAVDLIDNPISISPGLIPKNSERPAAIPSAQVELIPGLGHPAPLEQPERVAQAILAH
jgi:pimeloyl-ACP methyl ester carboxylesterase